MSVVVPAVHDGFGTRHRRAGLYELSRAECLRLLAQERFGRLVVALGDGHPLVRPVNYRFDVPTQSVVFRTSHGSKLYALLGCGQATFEIDRIDESTRTGWSVIVQGVASQVTDRGTAARLERVGVDCWAPGPRPVWMQIRAWTVSGRRIFMPVSQPEEYLG